MTLFSQIFSHGLLKIIIEQFEIDAASRRIKKHFRLSTEYGSNHLSYSGKILVEWPQIPSNNLAIGLFIKQLSKESKAGPIAYKIARARKFSILKNRIKFPFSVFKSLGIESFVYFNAAGRINENKCVAEIISQLKDPEDLLNLKYREIIIGDLIYDTYLTRLRVCTVDLTSIAMEEIVEEAMRSVDQLLDYFSNNQVSSVIISHSVYLYGIIARVAFLYGAEVFMVQTESIFRLTTSNPTPFLISELIREKISTLTTTEKVEAIASSNIALSKRFNGQKVPELELSSGIAFRQSEKENEKKFKNNGRINVLIATHDFFDAPHCYGNFFYPDFYLWLVRLKELSKNLNYNWYIKIHPDARGAMADVINNIFADDENFTILPREISHNDIINSKINVALTVHGTIGMEYPLFGIPVVNASPVNPHFGFDFCINPSNKALYEHTILNLDKITVPTNSNLIYLFHHIKHNYYPKSWVFKDSNKMLNDLGGWEKSMTTEIYNYYLDSNNTFKPDVLAIVSKNFISSNEFRVSRDLFP